MKNTRKRSVIVLFLSLVFFVGLSFFVYEFINNSKIWALHPVNSHLNSNGLAEAGKILDRNNIVLAQSINKKRVYHEDSEVRKAMLHVIGDENDFISTSIQKNFKHDLFGYNFFTGINTPVFLKKVHDIKLNLDSNLCKLAMKKFQEKKGTAVIYNYKTGEILCLVSLPTFDINNFPNLKNNPEKYEGVYLNRALSSNYTPGSVFKIITAICAIENNFQDKNYTCDLKENINNEEITCMGRHGKIDLKDAIKHSCNIAMGHFAIELGKDKMTKTCNNLKFNNNLKIDNIKIKESVYNVSEASEAQLAWSGIGQYKNLLNPMHMLTIMGAIANEGLVVTPSLINNNQEVFTERYFSKETADKIKEILRYTVKSRSEYENLFKNLEVCAKTGTAEVDKNKKPHSWAVGFSQKRDFPYAFVVIAENSGFGGKVALPIASELFSFLNDLK